MNFSATREYLDYYEEHKIIPVLSLRDLKKTVLKKQRFGFFFKIISILKQQPLPYIPYIYIRIAAIPATSPRAVNTTSRF